MMYLATTIRQLARTDQSQRLRAPHMRNELTLTPCPVVYFVAGHDDRAQRSYYY